MEEKISKWETSLMVIKTKNYNKFLREKEILFNKVLHLLQVHFLVLFPINKLNNLIVSTMEGISEDLKIYKTLQYGSALIKSFLNDSNNNSLNQELLMKLLTFFKHYDTKNIITLHFYKDIGIFTMEYLKNNNNYVCCHLFQMINTWSKQVFKEEELSNTILTSLVNLTHNNVSFNDILQLGVKNDDYVLPHMWSVLTKIVKVGGCKNYFYSVKSEIANKSRDAVFTRSLICLLDIGDAMSTYLGKLGYINNGNIFLIYLNSYIKLLDSMSEDDIGKQMLTLNTFQFYFINSVKNIDYLLNNRLSFLRGQELFSDTEYYVKKLLRF